MDDLKTCLYCQKKFLTKDEALACKSSHREDIVFVPILKQDLSILAHFIMTGNMSILTERASNAVLRYFKSNR